MCASLKNDSVFFLNFILLFKECVGDEWGDKSMGIIFVICGMGWCIWMVFPILRMCSVEVEIFNLNNFDFELILAHLDFS